MNLTTLLLLTTLSATAQVTLTPMQVRKTIALLDDRNRLEDELSDTQAELSTWQAAFTTSEQLRIAAEADKADLNGLLDMERTRAEAFDAILLRANRKAVRRARLAYVLGALVVVETVVIGVAISVR